MCVWGKGAMTFDADRRAQPRLNRDAGADGTDPWRICPLVYLDRPSACLPACLRSSAQIPCNLPTRRTDEGLRRADGGPDRLEGCLRLCQRRRVAAFVR